MTDRDYERMARRRRTQRKSLITTIIAGVIIIAAVIAIIVVIVSLIKSHSSSDSSDQTSAAAATEQPTYYLPGRDSSETPTAAPQTPTQQSPYTPTEAPAIAPTEAPYEPDTEAPAEDATAPADAGSAETADDGVLHVYAYGKTSTGYNWTYSSDGASVDIKCKYHFDYGQYDFRITGVIPGTTSFTLVYYTDDNKSESIDVTVNVDENLRVTRID